MTPTDEPLQGRQDDDQRCATSDPGLQTLMELFLVIDSTSPNLPCSNVPFERRGTFSCLITEDELQLAYARIIR